MKTTRKGIAEALNATADRSWEYGGDYFSAVTKGEGRILMSAFLSFGEKPVFSQFVRWCLGTDRGNGCEVTRTGEIGNIATRQLADVNYIVYDANQPFSGIGSLMGLADTEAHAVALSEWMAGAGKRMTYRSVR